MFLDSYKEWKNLDQRGDRHLINVYLSQRSDIPRMLSTFGCLGAEPKARILLKELRKEEERLEKLERF